MRAASIFSPNRYVPIANYRYPAFGKRKGIVYFVHGYGEYCQRYAYFGKLFAEAGYDFAGIDQRNFGFSTYPENPNKGVVESWPSTVEDYFNFFGQYDDKYGGDDVPKYIVGHSMGALMSLHFTVMKPQMFKAMTIIAPYFTLYNEGMFARYRPYMKVLDTLFPTHRLIKFPTNGRQPEHIMHFVTDPIAFSRGKMAVRNASVTELLRFDVTSKNFRDRLETPFLMLLGSQDTLVDNEGSRAFARECTHPRV